MTAPSTLRLKQQPQKVSSPTQNIPSTLRPKQIPETRGRQFIENIKEVPGQLARGYTTGTLSQAGNILDILGLQSKETLPGEKAKRSREFGTLEKLEKGGVPSIAEFEELSDDDVLPRYSRLPNTQETRKILSDLGWKEPERAGGRYAHRAGEFLSGPPGGIKAPIGAAIVGQTAEEANLPLWMQAGAEMATLLKLGKTTRPISSGSPHVQKELDRLKGMGFSDKDLTLARNALEDRGYLKKAAKYTSEAEKRFKDTQKNIQGNFESIIEESFPGLKEGGPQTFKNSAVELYDNLDNLAREVTIKNPDVFVESSKKAIHEMERSLANSPQKQEAIDILRKAATRSKARVPGDFYTNFYKEMNAIGNWGNPKQREAAFGAVKNAIKDTFRKQGPEGIRLADNLEEANKAWMKYLEAEDVSNLIGKVSSEEGINFKKMQNLLQKSDNFEIFKKGLGEKQANNLLKLSEMSSNIVDFEKAIKGGLAKDLLTQGTLYGFAKAVLNGDLNTLKTMAGVQIAGMFATKLLTDPNYQNLAIRMSKAAQDQNWKLVYSLGNSLQKKTKKDSTLKKKIESNRKPK